MELIILTLSTRQQPDANSVYLKPNLILHRDEGPDKELQELVGRLIDDCVLPLYAMELSEKEKVCIRGLMLFCPGESQ